MQCCAWQHTALSLLIEGERCGGPFSVCSSSYPIATVVVLTFLRYIHFYRAAVLDTFGTTSSHDDVYN